MGLGMRAARLLRIRLAESLPGFQHAMKPVLRSPAEGADTAVWLAASDDAARVDAAVARGEEPESVIDYY